MSASVTICALRSGSSGNAVFIRSGATRLLLDAGVCARTIEASLQQIGEHARDLDAILVTHEHSDHMAGVGVMMRRYGLPLHASEPTFAAMQRGLGKINSQKVNFIVPGQDFHIGDFFIRSFSTPHDAVDPVGFRLETDAGAFTLMTDLGRVTDAMLQQASGSKAVLIEANYDPMMLMAGKYPYALKQRISGEQGHLSNEDSARAILALLRSGTQHFQLAHLSRDNNYPELADLTVKQVLQESGVSIEHDLTLQIARRFEVSPCLTF